MLEFQPPCSALEFFDRSCNGLVFDYSNGLVAVCTDNYCVQLYSLFDDREISEVILSQLQMHLVD